MHEETIKHLSDSETGHLRAEHPLRGKMSDKKDLAAVKKGISASRDKIRTPGYLIFVEVEWRNGTWEIVSLGQNYRYRWRYADTVHMKGGRTRAILRPLPSEHPASGTEEHRPPQKLSGARLLFGYVAAANNIGTAGIGAGDYRQLAGRLAFNIAVEHVADGLDDRRFLEEGRAIPLKILGQPKPSAMEDYLDQSQKARRGDKGEYVSYGDIAGEVTGDLNGRKFYRHQPNAATDPTCYRAPDEDKEAIAGDQAALARFVSKPGTEFRFTLRFRDLRHWELGAVLVALDPARLEGAATEKDDMTPLYALKLGHGRPLGLGSVKVAVDRTILIDENGKTDDGAGKVEEAIGALRAMRLDDRVKKKWLELHRYKGCSRYNYPADFPRNVRGEVVGRRDGSQPEMTIFNTYTNRRRKHSIGRRLPE